MARQATTLWAQCPPPGVLISLAGAVGAAAAVKLVSFRAVTRANMRFVATKTLEQQSCQTTFLAKSDWLSGNVPCSIIAEHSVEGCDHFSHDGDDDDLECQTAVIESARTRLA